jgi:excisionase family DNA binding protein
MTSPTITDGYMTPSDELDPDEPDMTVPQLAKVLGLRPETVRRYLAEGAFPNAYRTANGPKARWRIPRASVIAWRRNQRRQNSQ